jgi:hypothetical protein
MRRLNVCLPLVFDFVRHRGADPVSEMLILPLRNAAHHFITHECTPGSLQLAWSLMIWASTDSVYFRYKHL